MVELKFQQPQLNFQWTDEVKWSRCTKNSTRRRGAAALQINLCRGLIVKFLIVLNTTPGKLSFINVSDWPRISPHFQLFEKGIRGFCPKSFSPNKLLNLRCHVSSSLSRHRFVVNERCSEETLTGCRLDIPSVKRGVVGTVTHLIPRPAVNFQFGSFRHASLIGPALPSDFYDAIPA